MNAQPRGAVPLRIAVVTQGYFSAGGVQTVARWLVRGLRELGHAVEVHDLGGYGARTGPSAQEPDVMVWRPRAHASDPLRYLPVPALTAALDGYDLVQVVCGGPALALVTARTRTPVLVQVATRLPWERSALRHGDARQRVLWLQAQLVGALEGPALRVAEAVLVENPLMADEARRLGARDVVLAPPGVDVHRFTPPTEHRHPDAPFLSVCRLWDPRKGLDRLIRAYDAHVDATGDERHLVLAGRGQLHPDAAAALAVSPHRDRVVVRSDVPREELPALYRSAGQFWQASYEEGLGISALEAMASGLPVVATSTAGSAECVLDGRTGVLVPQEDGDDGVIRAWSPAVQRATEHASAWGAAGRARAVEVFSDEATLGRYDAICRRVAGAAEEDV